MRGSLSRSNLEAICVSELATTRSVPDIAGHRPLTVTTRASATVGLGDRSAQNSQQDDYDDEIEIRRAAPGGGQQSTVSPSTLSIPCSDSSNQSINQSVALVNTEIQSIVQSNHASFVSARRFPHVCFLGHAER